MTLYYIKYNIKNGRKINFELTQRGTFRHCEANVAHINSIIIYQFKANVPHNKTL